MKNTEVLVFWKQKFFLSSAATILYDVTTRIPLIASRQKRALSLGRLFTNHSTEVVACSQIKNPGVCRHINSTGATQETARRAVFRT